jgi:hypothetical protein
MDQQNVYINTVGNCLNIKRNAVLTHATTWINPQTIKRCQSKVITYFTIPLIGEF